MNRISVVGTSGSGKTTLAGNLSKILGLPHFELDALRWEPGWREAPRDVFRSRVAEAIKADCWVVDGNYRNDAQDLLWERVDTVVWLNYSFPVTLYRVVSRTLRRVVTRQKCCNGNQES